MKPFQAHARLARPTDRMPWKGRLFGVGTDHPGYEIVDTHDGFTLALIADGSILLENPPEPAQPEPAAPHPDP